MKLVDTLRHVDYNALDISDYSRRYIQSLLPILDYYLDICNRALDLLPASTHCLVDYGGGHGFLCLLAKQRGIPKVIYIDHNPQGAQTVTALAEHLGLGPDVVLTGDQTTLQEWCHANNTLPDALVGIDVIEHIYRLEPFFDTLHTLNPQMAMVFSTASTPYNPFVRRRLERIMRMDEEGSASQKGFRELRREHIATLRPNLTVEELDSWAYATRGLTFDDITLAHRSPISALHSPLPAPNTCDPATGSWTERIIPLKEYRRIVAPRCVTLKKGFYNDHHPGLKGLAARGLNLLLRLPLTRWLAPFIILEVK